MKMARGGFKGIGDNDEYFWYKLNNLKIWYAAHPMLAVSFENSKRIMLVTWLEGILNIVRNNWCLKIISIIGLEE